MLVRVLTPTGLCIGQMPKINITHGNRIKCALPCDIDFHIKEVDNKGPEPIRTFEVEICHAFYVLVNGDIDRVHNYLHRYGPVKP